MNNDIVINPKYERLRPWVSTVPDRFYNEGTVIYDARNQIRTMVAPDGTKVCVKRFHCPAWLNRIVYTWWRTPKAVRAYDNARMLTVHGIGTPDAIGYILVRQGKLLAESYLISCQSELSHNFYEFRHHPLKGYEDVVRAFARFTAYMHEQQILHKDYSPGNILWDRTADGKIAFELVDINRMQTGKPIDIDAACRNFCRLWGNEDFFLLLADEYAKQRGMDRSKCRYLTLKYWRRFWRFRK